METNNKPTVADKVIAVVRVAIALGIIVVALLQLLGVWKGAINLLLPMMGVELVLQATQEWKSRRRVAVISICCAVIVVACAVTMWIIH